jgi:hypothetical protein
MMAPLIERNASPDICCLLFVNNFYSGRDPYAPARDAKNAADVASRHLRPGSVKPEAG